MSTFPIFGTFFSRLADVVVRFASKNDYFFFQTPALSSIDLSLATRCHRLPAAARGMTFFFPVLSQGTRAGKKDDTRMQANSLKLRNSLKKLTNY